MMQVWRTNGVMLGNRVMLTMQTRRATVDDGEAPILLVET